MLSGYTLTLTGSSSGSNTGASGYALAADHAMLKTVPRRIPRAAVRASSSRLSRLLRCAEHRASEWDWRLRLITAVPSDP